MRHLKDLFKKKYQVGDIIVITQKDDVYFGVSGCIYKIEINTNYSPINYIKFDNNDGTPWYLDFEFRYATTEEVEIYKTKNDMKKYNL